MTVAEISVRRPVTVSMLFVLVCVVAAIFVPRLGVALYPSTTMPVLTVFTSYSNAGPEEVDSNVTSVLESRLRAVSGLKSMTSTSSSGQSRIRLSFGYDIDLDRAMDDVATILNRNANSLPETAGTPTVRRFDMNSWPIMRLVVSGDLPVNELKSLAENTLSPMLERVEGVAAADVSGGADKLVRVDVNENRLQAYNLSLSGIATALSSRNIRSSGGILTENNINYQVQLDETYTSLEDIRHTIVATHSVPAAGSSVTRYNVVRLEDVAEVYEVFDYTGNEVYIDGIPGLYISITNTTDSNSTTVARSVRQALDGINDGLPAGVRVSILSDDTQLITATMNEVYSSAVQGGLLAMLIILLFLRSVKGTLIIALSMPISILVTLLAMSLMNLTLNMMTMTGLILGIGMIVDSSIVMIDNIHRYREAGDNSAVAAIRGSREMILAIVASTLTTLCVFVPVLIYKAELEMLGQMFNDMVLTVVFSLTVSLVVALTLVPALAGSILRLDTRRQKPLKNRILVLLDTAFERFLTALEKAYSAALSFALANRPLVLTLVLLLLVLSVIRFTSMGMSFAPSSTSDDSVTVSLSMPIGTHKSVTSDILFLVQDRILEDIEGFTNLILTVGQDNTGSIQIKLPPVGQQPMTPLVVQERLRPFLDSIPGATFSYTSGRGFRMSSPIDITLSSSNSRDIRDTVDRIIDILQTHVSETRDVTSDLVAGNPQYTAVIDRDRAASLGVSIAAVSSELRAALSGLTATSFQSGNNEIRIQVRLPEGDLHALSDLSRLYVTGSRGRVSLDNIVTFVPSTAPQRITREEGVRINHVYANLRDGMTASRVQPLVEAALSTHLDVPDSVRLSYLGEARDLKESGNAMIIVILIAVILVYIVMAAQFESLVDPFIIFLSIPLLAIGVVWVYVWTGQTFSLFSAVGVVALVGIVVNNGIVLVDYTNSLLRKKIPVMEACVMAGKNRLRPILMTTLTTVFATVPMGFFPGDGGEMMQPIGVTIVGGLVSGSLMTLFVTPIVYSYLKKRRERRFDSPDSLQNMLEGFRT